MPTHELIIQDRAEAEIRRHIHDAVWSACVECDGETGLSPSAIADEVLGTLQRREIAWALAYLAGVRMAPHSINAERRGLQGSDFAPCEAER